MSSEWEQTLRARLREFVGGEHYQKYVERAGMGRLQWWQEREWARFVAQYPEFVVSSTHLLRILQICPLHGTSLQADRIAVRPVEADDRYFEGAMLLDFPLAHSGWIASHRMVWVDDQQDVLFCSDCRAAEAAWLEREGLSVMPAAWLLERVELAGLAQHVERMLALGLARGGRDKVHRSAYLWREKLDWFLSEQAPEAELWTFRTSGPVAYPLRGGTGLAWVRGREVYHALYVVIDQALAKPVGRPAGTAGGVRAGVNSIPAGPWPGDSVQSG